MYLGCMEIICLEDEALYELFEKLAERLEANKKLPPPRWIDADEAMALLRIKKTSLQKLRDEGKIRYSKILAKNILYDRLSIDEFINNNSQNPFH